MELNFGIFKVLCSIFVFYKIACLTYSGRVVLDAPARADPNYTIPIFAEFSIEDYKDCWLRGAEK